MGGKNNNCKTQRSNEFCRSAKPVSWVSTHICLNILRRGNDCNYNWYILSCYHCIPITMMVADYIWFTRTMRNIVSKRFIRLRYYVFFYFGYFNRTPWVSRLGNFSSLLGFYLGTWTWNMQNKQSRWGYTHIIRSWNPRFGKAVDRGHAGSRVNYHQNN